MALPYENATAGEKALVEIQKTLAAFGCQAFGTMTDEEKGVIVVHFRWRNRTINLEGSWKGYAVAWQKAHPYKYTMKGTRADYDARALKQARISICSVLRDWVKGQVTAIECGVLTFEAAFMPHMLLPTGERLLDRVQSTVALLEGPTQPGA